MDELTRRLAAAEARLTVLEEHAHHADGVLTELLDDA
jgi:hypothetical protein